MRRGSTAPVISRIRSDSVIDVRDDADGADFGGIDGR
jgi:hypothetical protein